MFVCSDICISKLSLYFEFKVSYQPKDARGKCIRAKTFGPKKKTSLMMSKKTKLSEKFDIIKRPNFQVGDVVLLRNGYIGTIKYDSNSNPDDHSFTHLYGIELNEIVANGHDGQGIFTCLPQRGFIVLKSYIVTKLTPDGEYNINNNNNDKIIFPTYSKLKQWRKKQQLLLTYGYSRDLQSNINMKIIPQDVIQLCLSYNSYQPHINDAIQLKYEENKSWNIWSIGYSPTTKQLYFGVYSQDVIISTEDDNSSMLNFKKSQEIASIVNVDDLYQLQVDETVEYQDTFADAWNAYYAKAKVKYVGKFKGRDEQIFGIEFENSFGIITKPLNCHDGKGYFNCSASDNGYFAYKHELKSSRQALLAQLSLYVQGCFQDDPSRQFECVQRIRKLLAMERNPPIQEVIDSGIRSFIHSYMDILILLMFLVLFLKEYYRD